MKKILVIGATGAQGLSVASHLLNRETFAVRAMTRQPESERAQMLRARGAEVVRGELDDRASLRSALKGVYGVFGVEHENLVNAVAGAEVEHLVLSTLPPAEKWSLAELRTRFDIAATFVQLGDFVEEVGDVVAAIFERPDETIGRTFSING
jgi:saccharopine dehydrogenase-like NADP-dependent oxidoreductase